MTFATIQEAAELYRRGSFVIIVDDEDRENEGDLCIAAEKVTPETINFMDGGERHQSYPVTLKACSTV